MALAEAASVEPMLPVPDGMTVGRPFRTLACGKVRSRWSGEVRGEAITEDHLREMARVVVERAAEDPVVIDWGHGSSPSMPDSTDPARAASLGRVVGAYVADEGDGRGPGLYVIPAYTARGAALVADQSGALWSSPEFVLGDVYARAGDEQTRIGGAQLLAVALTNRPAQQASSVDPVTMAEQAPAGAKEQDMGSMAPGAVPPEMPEGEVDKDAIIAALQARVAELEAAAAEKPAGEPMVETLTERAAILTVEVQTLREQVAAEASRADTAERERAIDRLFAEGRIDGGDSTREAAREAWSLRESHPKWWAAFAEAEAGRFSAQRVSSPIGAPEGEVTPEDRGRRLSESVAAIMADRKCRWEDAVRVARAANPSLWEGV